MTELQCFGRGLCDRTAVFCGRCSLDCVQSLQSLQSRPVSIAACTICYSLVSAVSPSLWYFVAFSPRSATIIALITLLLLCEWVYLCFP